MVRWLVKVEEHSHDDLPRKLTINRLTDYSDSLNRHFPCLLDMTKFKVRELDREFGLRYLDADDGLLSKYNPYTGKTVVKYLDSDEDQSKFVLLTLNNSGNPGRLAVYTSWDQAWTVINDDMPCCYFCDVILFNGCFFAVTKDGTTTMAVDIPSLKLTVLAASPVFDGGGDKKFLIESSGEMLLVDMYLGMQLESDDLLNFEEKDVEYHFDDIVSNELTDKITVFKFVEREKSWVEVKDLGDKILFLGDDSSFSALASDFSPLYGGCVFFHGYVFDWEDLDTIDDEDVGVCDFLSQEIKLVRQHPEYAKLFWPPPSWFTD
ncbi:PREDICTED: F-box protein SKIP23-like [Camelina sativa]|uniref:F-box protein SKIP23-like n=1 Tax=Camelina sativa TaxID=90675 RepID=A0ABM0ZAQ6_CAMSA|nr:PREDICTED: F-box protein SKIP23-like [Camelina sativa]